MAKHYYLEIIEQLSESEQLEKEPLIVKVEVTDKAQAEALYPDYEADFSGKKYKVQYHSHSHNIDGQGINEPCSVEIIKEVNI